MNKRFLGFLMYMPASLTDRIIQNHGLNTTQCTAPCYDGASVMSGKKSGVQRRMQDMLGRTCTYVHCYAHRLNLVVVNTA